MKPYTIIIAPENHREFVFPHSVQQEIAESGELFPRILGPSELDDAGEILAKTEVIFSTWGMVPLNEAFLARVPNLKAVFYAAGSVKKFVTDASWERGILVSSAWAANGVPVAEYTLGTILLSLKRFWHFAADMRTPSTIVPWSIPIPGAYRSKVGLVTLGSIGRATLDLLKNFDVEILVCHRSLTPEAAKALGVKLVSLETIFSESDVISLHTPWLPETERMITGKLIASMRNGATLINTARGAIIAEDELCEVLTKRLDLTAILDVTYPEPPTADSPLRTLPNVVLTPHIAGSLQGECARMGSWMAGELRRFSKGKPLQYAVTKEMVARMA